jgi:hypothetical protein
MKECIISMWDLQHTDDPNFVQNKLIEAGFNKNKPVIRNMTIDCVIYKQYETEE